MDELFTSDIAQDDGELDQFTSSSDNTEGETDVFQEAGDSNGITIEMPEYGEYEQWGDESYTTYYPPYADGSAIGGSGELFTSSPTELPDQTGITGVEESGTENQRTDNTREDQTAQTTEDVETKEILKAILAKISESKGDETTETETTTEEPTETTTDPYIYAIQGISGSLQRLEERQEIGIKNTNLIGVSTVVLISALVGAFFINNLLGRVR